MTHELDLKDIKLSINTLPKLMHTIFSSFKPQFDIPIKKNEIRAIMEIHHCPNRTMKYYINAVDMESGSFTYLTDKLVEKNIILKQQSQNDKRKTTLCLSEYGEEITKELHKEINSHIRNLLKDLEEDDLLKLKEALETLDYIQKKLI